MKFKLLKPIYTVDGVRHEKGDTIECNNDPVYCLQLLTSGIAEEVVEKKIKQSEVKED